MTGSGGVHSIRGMDTADRMKKLNAAIAATLLLALLIAVPYFDPPSFSTANGWWGAVLQASVAAIAAFFAYLAFDQLRKQVKGEEDRHKSDRNEQRLGLLIFLRNRAADIRRAAEDRYDHASNIATALRNQEGDQNSMARQIPRGWRIEPNAAFTDWTARVVVVDEIDSVTEGLLQSIQIFNAALAPPELDGFAIAGVDHWERLRDHAGSIIANAMALMSYIDHALLHENGSA